VSRRKKGPPKKLIWSISAAVAVLVLLGGFLVVRKLILTDPGKRMRQIQTVTILKPPPPPKIKKEPPKPEMKKDVVEKKIETPEEEDKAEEDAPTDDQLGLDADGMAGSDAFGLKAKKGGQAIIGGAFGNNSLLRRYAWYARAVEEEIRGKVRAYLDMKGGIPERNLKTLVKIVLDDKGTILEFSIYGSSGNHRMDEAVMASIRDLGRVSEPLPGGLKKAYMKIKISSKG
jgi:protein TonB